MRKNAGVLLAIALGLAGAWMLTEYLTPCAVGTLCALPAVVFPQNWPRLLWAYLRMAYLDVLIRSAEDDAAQYDAEALTLPIRAEVARLHRDNLKIQRIDIELSLR